MSCESISLAASTASESAGLHAAPAPSAAAMTAAPAATAAAVASVAASATALASGSEGWAARKLRRRKIWPFPERCSGDHWSWKALIWAHSPLEAVPTHVTPGHAAPSRHAARQEASEVV
eukprot:scaffold3166_cov69-Phaeocystis_antarctica.AAC.5